MPDWKRWVLQGEKSGERLGPAHRSAACSPEARPLGIITFMLGAALTVIAGWYGTSPGRCRHRRRQLPGPGPFCPARNRRGPGTARRAAFQSRRLCDRMGGPDPRRCDHRLRDRLGRTGGSGTTIGRGPRRPGDERHRPSGLSPQATFVASNGAGECVLAGNPGAAGF